MNRLGARSVAAMLTLAVLVGPDAIQSPAPSASAQTLSAETLVLTASELGPGWSLSKDPERGNGGGLDSYSAVYPNLPALRVVAVRVIAAITTDVADQTLTDLQNAYTTDGVAFSSHIGLGNGPAFKGTRTGDQVLWVFYVFRVNSSSALVQFLGPTDQEADIQVQALRYATAQQDKMQVAAASELAALPSVAVLAPSSTYSTTNGLKTETQLRDELAVAGYRGPWDTSSVLTAYQRCNCSAAPGTYWRYCCSAIDSGDGY